MTEIDTAADIDIVMHGGGLTVRIPLAGQATLEWCERYRSAARRQNLPARAEEHPGRAWILVDLPSDAEREDALASLEAALDLIGKADTRHDQDPEETAVAIRGWWAKQKADPEDQP